MNSYDFIVQRDYFEKEENYFHCLEALKFFDLMMQYCNETCESENKPDSRLHGILLEETEGVFNRIMDFIIEFHTDGEMVHRFLQDNGIEIETFNQNLRYLQESMMDICSKKEELQTQYGYCNAQLQKLGFLEKRA